MYYHLHKYKRQSSYFILFLVLLSNICCKEDKKNQAKSGSITTHEKSNNKSNPLSDSITISVNFSNAGKVGFDIPDEYFNNFNLEFKNDKNNDSVIEKRIKRPSNAFVITNGIVKKIDRKINILFYSFFLGPSKDHFKFLFNNEYPILINEKESKMFFNLHDLSNNEDYLILNKDIKKDDSYYKKLDSLFLHYKTDLNDNRFASKLNEYFYYNKLSERNPKSKVIGDYLKKEDTIIYSSPLNSLFQRYIRHNINAPNFLPSEKDKTLSEGYRRLFPVQLFKFLSLKQNKNNPEYAKARNWLKQTEFYKKNAEIIDEEIATINNEDFKDKLNETVVLNKHGLKKKLTHYLEENPADFYLIDFWATWCKPCIAGVHKMKKMKLPDKLAVISISLDEPKNFEKWKSTTTVLKQTPTYFMSDKKENKEFLKFLEVTSIPRYVLLDKNLNILNEDYFSPEDSKFLIGLDSL